MSTYSQLLYHIVWATRSRAPVLDAEYRKQVYAYIHGILTKKNCHTYRIGGHIDHVHMLVSIHPSIAVADLMRELKSSSSKWISKERIIEPFGGWQDGYGIFTVDWQRKDPIIEYIKGQEDHHRKVTFEAEYRKLVEEAGLIWLQDYQG